MASLVQVSLVRVSALSTGGGVAPVCSPLDPPATPVTVTADAAEAADAELIATAEVMGSNRREFLWRIAVIGDVSVIVAQVVGLDELAISELDQTTIESDHCGLIYTPGVHFVGVATVDEFLVVMESPAAA